MIEELVSRVFYSRNLAHAAHWKTTSFSQHSALDEFYNGVIEALDSLVEKYQGRFDLIGNIPAPAVAQSDILTHLIEDSQYIEANRDDIAQGVQEIGNLIDEVSGVYLEAIYKLRNLK